MAEQLTPAQLVEVVRADRRRRWQQGERVLAETYLERYPALQADPSLAVELVYHEVLLREELGEAFALEEYLQRFPQLTAQLEPLFEVHRALAPGGLFDTPAPEEPRLLTPQLTHPPEDLLWPEVPGYEILDCLGKGGMGVVYRARHGTLGREVALKLIAAEAGAADRARFRAEAEAQARLQHPHIVQIHEVGEAAGRPYLALEYLAGGSLDQQLAGKPQAPAAAAQLVETLARAVHDAHQHGLVHRDLKPANVLLTTDGTPKVSDFGLAKRWQEQSGLTRSGELVGTPSYMAPEQAAPKPTSVGPPADVYALGAILYEMLTGRPPFLAETVLDTLLQVRLLEPVPPRRLQPKVPKDLETICLKCLHKEPARRYASAEALADDLRRFRQGEPIRARPTPVWEKTRKWAQRKPTAAALVGVAVLSLVGGTAGGLWYAARERDRANQESALRQQAEQAEQQARDVLAFFQEQVLAAARPENQEGGLGIHATIRDAVQAAEPKIAGAFQDRPLVEASIRDTLGMTYLYLREDQAAIAQHEQALALRRHHLGPDHLATLTSMNNLALAYRAAGQRDQVVPLLEEVVAKRREKLGPDHPHTLRSLNNLAQAYREAGRLDQALPLFEQALAKYQAKLGPDHPHTLASMCNLANAYLVAGERAKALPLLEQALAKRQEQLGPDHPHTLTSMCSLASAYQEAGQLEKAIPLLERALAKQNEKLGPDHPDTLKSLNNLAAAYWSLDQLEKAMPLWEQVLAKRTGKLGPDHPDTLTSMVNLAMAYNAAGKLEKAVSLLEQTLAKLQAKLGPDHPHTLSCMHNLAGAYSADGRLDRALSLWEQTLAKRKQALGPDHPHTLMTMNNLASAYQKAGRLADALRLQKQTLNGRRAKLGPDHPDTLSSMGFLAIAYLAAKEPDQARPLLRDYLAAWRQRLGPDDPRLAGHFASAGRDFLNYGLDADAEGVLREGLTLADTKWPADWRTFQLKSLLGASLLGQQQYAEAEPLLLAGYEGLKQRQAKIPARAKKSLPEALERLVQLYEAWGKPDQAQQWRAKKDQTTTPRK